MPHTRRKRLLSAVGIALLVINVPFGYGGMAIAGTLAVVTGKPVWALIGGVIYGISWIMLGIGLFLTGKEGIQYIKGLRGRLIRRRHDKQTSHS